MESYRSDRKLPSLETIQALRKAGLTMGQIGVCYGVSKVAVYWALNRDLHYENVRKYS